MATYKASDVTAGAAKAIHAGLNTQISDYLIAATPSASDVIQFCNLPAGAEVVDVKVLLKSGTPAGGVAVADSEGNQYLATATPTLNVALVGTGSGFGNRLTGDATLQMTVGNFSAALAATASADYRVITQYLSERDGD